MSRPSRRLRLAVALVAGSVASVLAPASSEANVVAAQSNGKVIVTVQRKGGVELARLKRSGELDRGFGRRGFAKIGERGARTVTGLVVAGSGKIDVAGRFRGASKPNQFVVQLTKSGDLDRAFASNGISEPFLDSGFIEMGGLASTPDGHLVVAAAAGGCQGCNSSQLITSMTAAGEIDPTFGDRGVAEVPTPSSHVEIAVTPDGRIITGTASSVARLSPNGSLDPSFGAGSGYVKLAYPVDDVASSDTGAIYAGGIRGDSFEVSALAGDGSVNPGFANSGVFSQDTGDITGGFGSLLRQSSGDLLIAGPIASDCRPPDPSAPLQSRCQLFAGLIRLDLSGKLDASFGSNGLAKFPIASARRIYEPGSEVEVVESRDGLRLVAPSYAGRSTSPGAGAPDRPTGVVVTAVRDTGSLDRSYGKHGQALISANAD
jgi:uncharacterized delta-60 repeat protein